jgi:MFS superfamily sulfate permease-like transporter
VIRRRASLPLLFLGATLVLVPWSGWLVISLPCRYLSRHWGIAWAGFDAGLAITLALTGLGALRRAAWLDRAAVAAGTLLAADAWFDVLTSRGSYAVALAATEALAIELPLACLCIWLAHAVARPRAHDSRKPLPTTHRQGAIR